MGKRVLLIDADAQGNLTDACGPGITQATLNAFGAADQILIPTRLDRYFVKGIPTVGTAMRSLRSY